MRTTALFAISLAGLVATSPAVSFAQSDEVAAPSAPEPGDPVAKREILNARQAERAQRQLAQDARNQAAYDATVATDHAEVHQQRAAYHQSLREYQRAQSDYRAARAAWEQANPYCRKGDPVRCPPDPETSGG
ncbi:hypothetical protein ASE49_06475 [Novosphingobium sp. Leaf2]|nr:hypothetical protein ASE49_06475 [Novosphingobium sp. Leaf2]